MDSSSSEQQDRLLNALNELLNSIQSHVFFSIKKQLDLTSSSSNGCEKASLSERSRVTLNNINTFVISYSKLLIDKSEEIINLILKNKELVMANRMMLAKLKCFFNKIVYNYVLWLIEINSQLELETCTSLAQILIEFHNLFVKIEAFLNQDAVLVRLVVLLYRVLCNLCLNPIWI
jgi:hypothetical protein